MSFFKKKPIEPLEGCAYCKGAPKLMKIGDKKQYFVYKCSNCFTAPALFDEAKRSERGAREMWNKRTKEAQRILDVAAAVDKYLEERGKGK